MANLSLHQSPRSLFRRTLALSGLLLCLSMATTNLVGAFANDNSSTSTVSVAADLKQALGADKKTVVLTLVSRDAKAATISKIQSLLDVTVHDDLDELPIISVDNIGQNDIDTLISIEGIVGIEPVREFSNTSVDYLEAVHAVDVKVPGTTGQSQKVLDGTGSTIGIIDSGINANHPQFKTATGNRIVSQGCVNQPDVEIAPCSTVPNQSAQIDCTSESAACWHGHAVAGFAAGEFTKLKYNDGSGEVDIQGTAPKANISYFRIADSEKNGPTNISILAGFNKFLGDKRNNPKVAPDVINLSIGWEYEEIPSCGYFTSLKLAIDTVVNSGIAVVVASGNNSNKSHIASPACLDSVIAVGATEFEKDSTGKITGEHVAKFSNSSPELDLVAPGTDIVGSTPGDDYFTMSGTSFASPIVAGAIALLKQAKPSLTPVQMKSLLISTADLVKEPANGKTFPRINVAKAVASLNSTPTTTTTTTTPTTTIPTSTTSPTTTVAPTTTIAPTTTRPVPGTQHSALTSLAVSSNEILSGEKVMVEVGLTNNGTSDINNIETRLMIRGNVLKTSKTDQLVKDASGKIVLETELSVLDLAFAGKGYSKDATPNLSNDIVAVSCWDTNVCVEAKQNVTILNAPPSYERSQHSTSGGIQTYTDTITNSGTETITNLVVTDTGLGVLKFDKSTLKPGESATTGIMDVGADYAPGFWEIKITGTVLGRSGSLGELRLDESEFPTIDPGTTTTTTTATTAVPVTVAGQSVSRTVGSQSTLPFTGSSTTQLFFAAIWILLAGVMLLCFKEGFTQRALARVHVTK